MDIIPGGFAVTALAKEIAFVVIASCSLNAQYPVLDSKKNIIIIAISAATNLALLNILLN